MCLHLSDEHGFIRLVRSSIYEMGTEILFVQGFYLPYAMLALDLIFGAPLTPDILGMVVGHLYYFLTVLHPLARGTNLLKTPLWVYPYFNLPT